MEILIGDPTKAQEKLGGKPKCDLQYLLKDMVMADIKLFKKDLDLIDAGHIVLMQGE